MSNKVVETMRAILSSQIVNCLAGTINSNQENLSLGSRGGVYGIAIKLEEDEKEKFFNNYNENISGCEEILRNEYPDIFRTHTGKYNYH